MQHRELYSTLCADLRGKDIGKEGMHVYVWLMHFSVQQKLTRHCKVIY